MGITCIRFEICYLYLYQLDIGYSGSRIKFIKKKLFKKNIKNLI